MNKNTECYYKSALKFFLPVSLESAVDGFSLTLGKKRYFFYGMATPLNNAISVQISRNKYFTNKILEKAGFPVPKAIWVHGSELNDNKWIEKIAGLTFPLVAKPLDEGKFGHDVLCNIQTVAQLETYLKTHAPRHPFILIEEFHANLKAYRVLVFNGRVIGVIQRTPAQIIGDGAHTVQELIDISNQERMKQSDTLGPIRIDDECHIRLSELAIDEYYIPKANECITLCYTCNASRGGTYASLGKKIAKENRMMLVKAARALNLKLVGFDVQCADIMQPIEGSAGVIIESNDSPSVRIHEHALEGMSVAVTRHMIRSFIYRHPLAYLKQLYHHQLTSSYVRSLLLIGLAIILYQWL